MRLYSRAQVAIVALCSIIAGLLLAIGFGLLPTGLTRANQVADPSSGNVAGSNDAFQLDGPAASAGAETDPAPAYAPEGANGLALNVDSPVSGFSASERENIDVYERLNTGVVNVTTEVVALNWFLEPIPREGGSGSGSIIDARGYVLTNNHVIANAVKVYVSLADGNRYEGQVIGSDVENDLAIIKFNPPAGTRLTVIPFGQSGGLRVGQKVLAIGNPFGLERTLTTGVVSSLGRPIQSEENIVLRDMIQTDASINPGNSGGPLLNARGEMIGINTVIYSTTGGSVGVGFAVPVDTARRVVPELIEFGRVRRGWIEAEFVQIFPALVEYMQAQGQPLPVSQGLLVSSASRSGNADRAGIQGGSTMVRYYQSRFNIGGDVIVSIDGLAVASVADLYAALEDNKPGDRVRVEYYRGGRRVTVELVLADRAETLVKRN
ncbi:MAG: peptidase S1 [Spirochaetes bacterium GWD1_61_31]|nr:MAG: peptidase S1 [Spirochaetes bacterium GWB1_60_80]OHD28670.1 MAG: peptidase S1 [Spirochaetes bacterium GWC1_61_12]OHD34947.1 MAG: peptidase S1 [Spirochaetes bacterium GWD1_61_31]OHD43312.1 MAG: peptidase S1 [Spirochaetes bacterium GWE1_60_18]OHD58850.1 MAG: peptidase S1 [Spirochaetes bacterium GWF1_60_12]HAP42504.1 peptidase S1 [Spirochaetaceae bacterium]